MQRRHLIQKYTKEIHKFAFRYLESSVKYRQHDTNNFNALI